MQASVLQAIENLSASFANADHGGQVGGWIIAIFAVGLTLSSFITLRRAPLAAPEREGTVGDGVGDHVAGYPGSVLSEAVDNS